VTLEIAKDVVVKVSRDAIGAPLKDGGAPASKDVKKAGG
jgi:hypothetical protein